jgi:hypothetical protein
MSEKAALLRSQVHRHRKFLTITAVGIILAGICLPVFPASRVRITGLRRNLGIIPKGRVVTNTITITNFSIYLVSVYVGKGCGCQPVRLPDAVIGAMASADVLATYSTATYKVGSYREAIQIGLATAGGQWEEASIIRFVVR